MWSNSFNIVIGQCFSLVCHKTCRDSQKQSTITPPSRLEILNLGILTIFQVSSETGEWRLGPAATVHPSTQTAEHQSHPGVVRGPAPPHVRDQMDQIGAKTVSSLTNETTFFSSFFCHIPRLPVSLQHPSFQYRTTHQFKTRPEPSTALETTGAKQCMSPGTPTGPAAEERSGFAKCHLIFVWALFSAVRISALGVCVSSSRSSLEAMCGRPQTIVLQMWKFS